MPVVVIADDDRGLGEFMRCAFKMAAFEANTAFTAEECLDKIKQIGADRVDAVCVNGQMASDMGKMLILNIHNIGRQIKIFVIADRYLEEIKTRILDYGANEFVIKPISINSMVEKVNLLMIEGDANNLRRAGGHA